MELDTSGGACLPVDEHAAHAAGLKQWSDMWPSKMMETFSVEQMSNMQKHDFITVGTDATGANAPIFAFLGLLQELSLRKIHIRVAVPFSSEAPGPHGDPPRSFQLRNHPAQTCHVDMCKRHRTAHDAWTDARVPLVQVRLYIAGFECHDFCSHNRWRKALDITSLSEPLSDGVGESTKTLYAALQYDYNYPSAVTVIQNTYKKLTVKFLLGVTSRCSCLTHSTSLLSATV